MDSEINNICSRTNGRYIIIVFLYLRQIPLYNRSSIHNQNILDDIKLAFWQ